MHIAVRKAVLTVVILGLCSWGANQLRTSHSVTTRAGVVAIASISNRSSLLTNAALWSLR
jgi:hypothetical protein